MAAIETADQKITPCLWFVDNAKDAVDFYISVFKNASIDKVSYYTEGGPMPKGTVLTISFTLAGQSFLCLNGGPHHSFNDAVSFVVNCDDQEEIDYYWNSLANEGKEVQCGWLIDKFGVSWQVVPRKLGELLSSGDRGKSQKVMSALMKMKKLDLNVLTEAYNE